MRWWKARWKGTVQFFTTFFVGVSSTSWGLFHLEKQLKEYKEEDFQGLDKLCQHYSDCSTNLLNTIFLEGGWFDRVLDHTGLYLLRDKLLDNITAFSIHNFSQVLASSWFYEMGGPQKMLELVQEHGNRQARIAAADVLASTAIPQGFSAKNILGGCDKRLLIGISRLPNVNKNIWETICKSYEASEEYCGTMEAHLKSQLLCLPLSGMDECTKWFTKSAILTGSSAKQHRRSMSWSFGGDHSLSFAHNLTSMPPEQVELFYLKALTRHSMVPSHRQLMIDNGILALLFQELKQRFNSLKIRRQIGLLLGNLSLEDTAHCNLVDEGSLPLLRSWLFSEDLLLVSHAARTLANLDRDFNPDELYDDGIYLLHPNGRQSDAIVADIVFVHGLRGGPLKTWRKEGPSRPLTSDDQCWPKAWLVNDFPGTRVLMVEYDSSLSNWFSQCPTKPETHSLSFRSDEIMKKLKRAGVGKRPVIWVTHSMGGLLVKQLLLHAQNCEEYRCMSDNSRGLVFYSTPHRGSIVASYSSQARYFFLLPSVEVKELTQGSPVLSSLHDKFLELMRAHPFLECLSFGETVPIQLSWMLKSVLVTQDSADPGVGSFHSVDVNHVDVCKPTSREDPRYQKTAAFIRKILQDI